MSAPIVFFDIAGPVATGLREFYADVFGWQISTSGSFTTTVISPTAAPPSVMGNVRLDPAEKLFYIGVDDIKATLEQVVAKGGSIDQPRFEVPGIVVLGLFNDPAGNRVGLVEMEAGQAKTP